MPAHVSALQQEYLAQLVGEGHLSDVGSDSEYSGLGDLSSSDFSWMMMDPTTHPSHHHPPLLRMNLFQLQVIS
jgi:hypothetical protein